MKPTVVIDVGCAKYGGDESIPYLIDEFKPAVLYGFDPSSEVEDRTWTEGDTLVSTRRMAAWTHDGTVGFKPGGLRGAVHPDGKPVPCIDLAAFVMREARLNDVVLKLDAEGSEYVLLPHLIVTGADRCLKVAWVEWHCEFCGRGWFGNKEPDRCSGCDHYDMGKRTVLERAMGCEMHQWNR